LHGLLDGRLEVEPMTARTRKDNASYAHSTTGRKPRAVLPVIQIDVIGSKATQALCTSFFDVLG
jgi:hypothetical protein